MPDRSPDGNVLALAGVPHSEELFERLVGSDSVLVERIVSTGPSTRVGEWLEQERDEWVVLLAGDAELAYADGSRLPLRPGDHVLIPAGERHRVERTSTEPPAVWLAVHAIGLEPAAEPTRPEPAR